jgi:hypothetical protein
MNIPRRWRRRARDTWGGVGRVIGLVASVAAAAWFSKGRRRPTRIVHRRPETADERTIRRVAEAQAGGISSQESDARYERGENPGGLHHKAERPPPDAEMFEIEEPPDRTQTHRGSRRTMASNRR